MHTTVAPPVAGLAGEHSDAATPSVALVIWVLRVVRPFLTPRWVVAHLLVWAVAVAMVLLGRWQLTVSNRKHFDLQNFGYAQQWWAFSIFVVVLWLRIMRDTRCPQTAPVSGAG